LHNLPPHLTPLYADASRHQIACANLTHRSTVLAPYYRGRVFFHSQLLTICFDLWKYTKSTANIDRLTFLPPGETPRLKSVCKLYNTVPPPRLTSDQQDWETRFRFSWTTVWQRIHSLGRGPHLRSLLWHIYTKTLPIPRGTIASSCPSCGEREPTLHIFTCRAVLGLVSHLAPFYALMFNRLPPPPLFLLNQSTVQYLLHRRPLLFAVILQNCVAFFVFIFFSLQYTHATSVVRSRVQHVTDYSSHSWILRVAVFLVELVRNDSEIA
jgi:hypothetical protein